MKVLWFTPTNAGYSGYSNAHNGGGWILSLKSILQNESSISLAIAFKGESRIKDKKNNLQYYIYAKDSSKEYQYIIKDFAPDIIHIFGSEAEYGLICTKTSIPVVIHLQGSMPPYHNAQYPPEVNKWSFLFTRGLSCRRRLMGFRTDAVFSKSAHREELVLQSCRFFMGRTEWDRNLVALYNPKALYFHCEEALRDSFVKTDRRWQFKDCNEIRIISVISNPWYKGVDLILKTADLLKKYSSLSFRWEVYGVSDIRFYEYKYHIRAKDVNVYIEGSIDKDTLVDRLIDSSLYVHTSYIDNSPNSLCEAQILGVPVLATYVGGIPSLVENGKTGILFPANAPHSLAPMILQLASDRGRCEALSKEEQIVASMRHNPEKIRKTIVYIYNTILSLR